MAETQNPSLEILVQPSSYADFRYATEMKGHLRGILKQCPKVKINNYDNDKAIIRCYVVTANSMQLPLKLPAPHINGLISRRNKNQHYQEMSAFRRNNFEVEWNIGIIQSKNPDQEGMLAENKKMMRQHNLSIAEERIEDIDPKIVRLYFHAFAENDEGLLEPVPGCGKVSEVITKQNDPVCGKLSIYHMSQSTARETGGDELILFVKNASQENTKVCFDHGQHGSKEMDKEQLTYLCSHAIKLLIPPYPTKINKETEVKIRLVRKGREGESEARSFTYKPIIAGKRAYSNNNESTAAKKEKASGYQQRPPAINVQDPSLPQQMTFEMQTNNHSSLENECLMELCQDEPFMELCQYLPGNFPEQETQSEKYGDLENLLNDIKGFTTDCGSQSTPHSKNNLTPSQDHKEKNERHTQCLAKEALSKLCDLMDHKHPSRLQKLKEIIRAEDSDYGPLHTAALYGQTKTLDCLLKLITDYQQQKLINCLSRSGLTPLITAVTENNVDCVEVLCKMGADVNLADNDCDTALHVAAKMKHHECLRKLLSGNKVDISKTNKRGMNALHIAVSQGDLQCVKLLLRAGADINSQTKTSGQTALHMAVELNYSDIVKYLYTQENLDRSIRDFRQKFAQNLVQSNQDDVIQSFKEFQICEFLEEQSNEDDTEESETEAGEDSEEENPISSTHSL